MQHQGREAAHPDAGGDHVHDEAAGGDLVLTGVRRVTGVQRRSEGDDRDGQRQGVIAGPAAGRETAQHRDRQPGGDQQRPCAGQRPGRGRHLTERQALHRNTGHVGHGERRRGGCRRGPQPGPARSRADGAAHGPVGAAPGNQHQRDDQGAHGHQTAEVDGEPGQGQAPPDHRAGVGKALRHPCPKAATDHQHHQQPEHRRRCRQQSHRQRPTRRPGCVSGRVHGYVPSG